MAEDPLYRLRDLSLMHPRLVWREIAGAAALVLGRRKRRSVVSIPTFLENVAGAENDAVTLQVDLSGISKQFLLRLLATYERTHLVEMAGIALAGVALYHIGGLEIRDVAVSGSGADYLVGDALVLWKSPGALASMICRKRGNRKGLGSKNGRRLNSFCS
ncbi:MAG: hypothetical protein HY040_00965 [Planctomycetes bacterium]|nr:hypothetical protein [Planctomycetota bacterium]